MHMKQQKKYRVYGPVATIFSAANTGSWRLERPEVNYSLCSKCGICAKFCPVNIIEINKELKECVAIDMAFCKGCGICANECPKGCIKMVPEKGGV